MILSSIIVVSTWLILVIQSIAEVMWRKLTSPCIVFVLLKYEQFRSATFESLLLTTLNMFQISTTPVKWSSKFGHVTMSKLTSYLVALLSLTTRPRQILFVTTVRLLKVNLLPNYIYCGASRIGKATLQGSIPNTRSLIGSFRTSCFRCICRVLLTPCLYV